MQATEPGRQGYLAPGPSHADERTSPGGHRSYAIYALLLVALFIVADAYLKVRRSPASVQMELLHAERWDGLPWFEREDPEKDAPYRPIPPRADHEYVAVAVMVENEAADVRTLQWKDFRLEEEDRSVQALPVFAERDSDPMPEGTGTLWITESQLGVNLGEGDSVPLLAVFEVPLDMTERSLRLRPSEASGLRLRMGEMQRYGFLRRRQLPPRRLLPRADHEMLHVEVSLLGRSSGTVRLGSQHFKLTGEGFEREPKEVILAKDRVPGEAPTVLVGGFLVTLEKDQRKTMDLFFEVPKGTISYLRLAPGRVVGPVEGFWLRHSYPEGFSEVRIDEETLD